MDTDHIMDNVIDNVMDTTEMDPFMLEIRSPVAQTKSQNLLNGNGVAASRSPSFRQDSVCRCEELILILTPPSALRR